MRLHRAILLLLVLAVFAPLASAQESEKLLPKVVEHAEPVYPGLARQARISGEVRVKFTTNGQSVTGAEAETGHELLRLAAEENIRTWKFVVHEPDTFTVIFRYRFQNGEEAIVSLPSSTVVDIAVPLPTIQIQWGWLGRGRWKAQLRSARGNSQRILEIQTSGPHEKWLKGDMINAHGQKEEIDDGYFDEDRNMFGFTLMFSQPKGEPLNTFFIGKLSGDKITGTFVNDAGTTRAWTAALEK